MVSLQQYERGRDVLFLHQRVDGWDDRPLHFCEKENHSNELVALHESMEPDCQATQEPFCQDQACCNADRDSQFLLIWEDTNHHAL